MHVPDALQRFANGFYQGSDRNVSTIEEWIASAVGNLSPMEKVSLDEFLTKVLNGNLDDAGLQQIWASTSADYYISGDGGIRSFFVMVRDSIR